MQMSRNLGVREERQIQKGIATETDRENQGSKDWSRDSERDRKGDRDTHRDSGTMGEKRPSDRNRKAERDTATIKERHPPTTLAS